MIGVTAVNSGRVVCCPMAASVTQACVAAPSGHHGAKWSEQPIASKPAASAAFACSSMADGGNSSVDAANQNWGTSRSFPAAPGRKRLGDADEGRGRGRGALALADGEDRVDDGGVELAAGAVAQLGERRRLGHGAPVGA